MQVNLLNQRSIQMGTVILNSIQCIIRGQLRNWLLVFALLASGKYTPCRHKRRNCLIFD